MKLLTCSVEVDPCPPESQQWLTVDQAFDPAALGIDAASVLAVASWGVGVVLFLWSLGYGIGAALKLIRMT